jgi:hypothetical protein
MVTASAGMIAVPYIQRHESRVGIVDRTRKPTAVPPSAPKAWKPNAASTSLPRLLLGMLSEMIMCAVG